MPSPIERLIAGFRSFRAVHYEQRPEQMRALVERGQAPSVLVIACSDSRDDPAILMNAQPGELFVVRNVANLVPPYAPDGQYHGTSSALEFAVRDLGVGDIVVLGHSACGGIQALHRAQNGNASDREFIIPWMTIARSACADNGNSREAEQAAIRISLRNLVSFPWVRERVDSGRLALHGWWFDLEEGALWRARGEDGAFERLV